MFTQEKGWCRKSSANALGLYFFFCCCFGNFNCYFVFFFCVSRACLQASTYQSVTWSSRIIAVASQAPAVPKSLINIPKRLSTLVPLRAADMKTTHFTHFCLKTYLFCKNPLIIVIKTHYHYSGWKITRGHRGRPNFCQIIMNIELHDILILVKN